MNKLKQFIKNNPEIVDLIGGAILIGVMAYMFYFALWVFCPCG